ncbi:NUP155 protein [Hibiscus syriacus]|uniref:NUP155 protein n=1 Tax=Hibiscus syriacus TaxID=106335 RepID=A0A6A3AN38_HIBSY|nr:NUP155 protein [Hibiscus syriacus]
MSWVEEIVLRDVTNAGLVVSDRIGREMASQLDLEEALEASRYTSHPYSTHPREWPPLIEVEDTWELPPVLVERYNAAGGEGTALCGIFPEIRRAWASVDNSLFLWRFDKWDGQCPEYNVEEQTICAVGLAKSRPGIFIEAIQYLLILATPVELILVGICCSGGGDNTDPYAEVSLQSLPEYTIPSDGVTMTCITCTDKGRIFMAGRDGHIYELHYTTDSGWHKCCRKVCHTAGNLGASARSTRSLRESVSSLPVEGQMLFAADVLPLPDTAATVLSLYSELEFCGFERSVESCGKASGKLWAIATAMCLMLAAKVVHSENLISNIVAEKAAEAFEDPRMVGVPQVEGTSGLSNTRTAAMGFSMGQVVQEADPVFSGAHEGLCLCSSRFLFPVWELPVMVVKGGYDAASGNGLLACRLSVGAMQVLENKIRALEMFLRSRRNKRRGLYGCVAGLGDMTGSILYGTGSELGAGDRSMVRNLFGAYSWSVESNGGGTSNKRQRLPYSPAELAAMEVRAMECIRQLLLRSAEALFLLQLVSQHHVTRLVQGFDANIRQELVQLTFHQLVCSEEGDRLATRLISALMEYYTGPDGRGTVDDVSGKLREGCPSYFKESDYKFFLAVECLERAAATPDPVVKENLAREAFEFLSKVPESADLRTVCKRFEDLRFYEAVVRLPLQKAQALDPAGVALNEQIDQEIREYAIAQREQCYEVITSALRSLKGEGSQREFGSPARPAAVRSVLDDASRPDLVPFLQTAGCEPAQEVRALSALTSATPSVGQPGAPIHSNQAKYFDLLARYYVLKRQHLLAAHVLLRLAERRSIDGSAAPSLEQRRQYLSNAVLQAKSDGKNDCLVPSSCGAFDSGLLDLLEGKLAVLQFQIKVKEELEVIATRVEATLGTSESVQNGSAADSRFNGDANLANAAREKAKELSSDLKSITQLGGVAEACSVLKRVGSKVYPGDGAVLPLDTLCLHLEKAAMERVESGTEYVGDEDVARALLGACKGAAEPALNTYDQLLSSGAILSSSNLRLRLLQSVLVVLREWAMSVFAQRLGTTAAGASLILGGTFSPEQTVALNQGIRDKITSAANRPASSCSVHDGGEEIGTSTE